MITQDHSSTQRAADNISEALLVDVISKSWKGRSKEEVREFAKGFSDRAIKISERHIYIGDITFIFDPNGTVESVYLFDDVPADKLEN